LSKVISSSEVPQPGSDQAITVQNLVKKYRDFVAVNDVSFSIKEGEIFGIIGPNGAGKTTAVECISGLRLPDSGSISIYGLSPQKDRNKIRKFVGIQLQESALARAKRMTVELERQTMFNRSLFFLHSQESSI
jgi:ABC-2 type transport system ATP-binding protein